MQKTILRVHLAFPMYHVEKQVSRRKCFAVGYSVGFAFLSLGRENECEIVFQIESQRRGIVVGVNHQKTAEIHISKKTICFYEIHQLGTYTISAELLGDTQSSDKKSGI